MNELPWWMELVPEEYRAMLMEIEGSWYRYQMVDGQFLTRLMLVRSINQVASEIRALRESLKCP